MAWRIHDNVIRGEIDNRQKGTVKGKVWLDGSPGPVLLELKGNACPDLAGCLLTFENPGKTVPLRPDSRLNPYQKGSIGDLTASRKVRVFDLPIEEAYDRLKKKLPVPEHIANCLYLEWFSEANGRVVIESVDYKLTISAPAWTLSPAENEQRAEQAAEGFTGFLQRISEALAASKHEPPPDKDWDEFDYEKFMRESDARTDKYAELLDKYRDDPDRDRIIAREMGWSEEIIDIDSDLAGNAQEEKPEPPGAWQEDDAFSFDPSTGLGEPAALQPDPTTEGVDWVRGKDDYISHPLALRTLEGSIALWDKCKDLGLEHSEDDDLTALVEQYQTTSAKLAGALDGLAYGRALSEGAFIVACLKRAVNHLHLAQAALEKVAAKKLLPDSVVKPLRAEFFGIREEVLRLMQEFRGK